MNERSILWNLLRKLLIYGNLITLELSAEVNCVLYLAH